MGPSTDLRRALSSLAMLLTATCTPTVSSSEPDASRARVLRPVAGAASSEQVPIDEARKVETPSQARRSHFDVPHLDVPIPPGVDFRMLSVVADPAIEFR
jgi:hypothetical protein